MSPPSILPHPALPHTQPPLESHHWRATCHLPALHRPQGPQGEGDPGTTLLSALLHCPRVPQISRWCHKAMELAPCSPPPHPKSLPMRHDTFALPAISSSCSPSTFPLLPLRLIIRNEHTGRGGQHSPAPQEAHWGPPLLLPHLSSTANAAAPQGRAACGQV